MSAEAITIEPLRPPVADADLHTLIDVLVDAVDSGAAVSFLAPLARAQAEQFWRKSVEEATTGNVVLVARDAEGIVGTVQLHPAWAPNQPHRADVAKLLVHRRGRERGIGTRLMTAVEAAARAAGFRLLTLDARRGTAAERLYRRIGWVVVGTIPRYALDPDRSGWHDTVVFYKELGSDAGDDPPVA